MDKLHSDRISIKYNFKPIYHYCSFYTLVWKLELIIYSQAVRVLDDLEQQ